MSSLKRTSEEPTNEEKPPKCPKTEEAKEEEKKEEKKEPLFPGFNSGSSLFGNIGSSSNGSLFSNLSSGSLFSSSGSLFGSLGDSKSSSLFSNVQPLSFGSNEAEQSDDKAGIEAKDESKLPPIVEAKTGEEDEENIVNITPVKLYKFEEEAPVPEKKDDEKEEKEKEKEKKEEKKKEAAAAAPVKRWVERCLGSFKVNVDKKTEKARVIMRTECTFNTRLNALILSSSKCTMDSNGRAFIFSTFETDAESGKAVFNIYMIRFNSKEKATAAFDAVTKEIEKAKQKDEDKKKEEEEEGK